MKNPYFEQQLSALEARLAELSEMLIADDPSAIPAWSAELHALAVACAQWGADGRNSLQAFKPRLVALARGLTLVREQLARRLAYVDVSLKVLIPTAAPAATYGSGKALYNGLNRMSGALRPVSA